MLGSWHLLVSLSSWGKQGGPTAVGPLPPDGTMLRGGFGPDLYQNLAMCLSFPNLWLSSRSEAHTC
jgi:hypothetical protein